MGLKATITEAEFTDQVLTLAKLTGWRTAHFRPAMTASGWRTAVQGDGKGFPDLVLVRPPRVIVAELKRTERDKPTPEQLAWLESFGGIAIIEVYVWRATSAEDWATIQRVLR